jgi:hypothetical protein
MENISINVLLTTIGRETLTTRMLPSLVNQLNENDYLTVVSDINHKFVSECLSQYDFKCTVTHIMNNVQLGFWGHESRNKWQNNLLGDFIMNADDDDRYIDGAFDMIRKIVIDNNKVYLFRVTWCEQGEYKYSWKTKNVLKIGQVGTMCGVIPNNKKLPRWEHVFSGDGEFYLALSKQLEFEFVDYVIYKMRDTP